MLRARRNHRPGLPAKVVQEPSAPAKDTFLRVYERSGDEREARVTAGITAKDLARLRLEDPEFDGRFHELEEQSLDKIEHSVMRIARDDPVTARWVLERRRPEKYGNRARFDINIRDVTKLSDEELDGYIAQCQGHARLSTS